MTTAVQSLSNDEMIRLSNEEPSGFGCMSTDRGMLPLEAMHIQASIVGLSASVSLAQTFRNTLSEPLEVTYIFPLPPRAAVSAFQVEFAGRVIEGKIKERGQARREYQEAIDTGHRAAITEEDRSGVFTMRVGNLMPGETAVVRLTLDGPLAIEDGDPCFRFPLVVAPRYMPGQGLPGESVGDGTAIDTDMVPDASRISPPVLLKGYKIPVQLSLVVDIDSAGLPLRDLRSSLHSIVSEERAGRTVIKLQPGERLDKDFILRFSTGGADIGTQLALCPDSTPQEDGNDGTLALTLMPPTSDAPAKPRDIIFVLDRSGSMSGWKMVAARRAVGRMLDTLGDTDRYSIFAFDNTIETSTEAASHATLGVTPQPYGATIQSPDDPGQSPESELLAATDRNRYRSLEWLAKLDARGGTEMQTPLTRSLNALSGGYGERDRMLVLITDGQVGNEDHILRSVAKQMRNVRVFTIGIDRAVNEGFLRKLAVLGGGACALVESEDRLDEVMSSIHRRISTPVITEVALVGEGIEIDPSSIVPRRLPDLFEASPIVLRARYRNSSKNGSKEAKAILSGCDAVGESWKCQVSGRQTEAKSFHSIWARGRVRDLEDQFTIGTGDQGATEQSILNISLGFGVLSRFTAFVAVDTSEVVNPGGDLATIVQPVESPDGWDKNLHPQAEMMRSVAAMPEELAGGVSPMSTEVMPIMDSMAAPFPASISPYASAPPAPMAAPQSASMFGASAPRGAPRKKMSKPSLLSRARAFVRPAPERMEMDESLAEESVEEESNSGILVAYKRRLSELLERSEIPDSKRARLRIILQGLKLMLDDLKSVQAPAEFVDALTQSLQQLRAMWKDADAELDITEVVSRLNRQSAIAEEETRFASQSTSSSSEREFWK